MNLRVAVVVGQLAALLGACASHERPATRTPTIAVPAREAEVGIRACSAHPDSIL